MRRPSPSSGGGVYVSELQRARLLDAIFAVVAEQGYRGMAVRAVAERSGVSSKTFYDLFRDREDAFLAAFDYGIERLAERVGPAYTGEQDWVAGVRGALGVLLGVLDREPALTALLFAEALAAGPRVLERRVEVLGELARVIDRGREGAGDEAGLSALTAEGVVGAVFGVIHVRLLQPQLGPLSGLLSKLMATIVLPYRGRGAAARELERPVPELPKGALGVLGGGVPGTARALGSGPAVDFRLTVRSRAVLRVVGELGAQGLHPSNQRVSELAGISDQGQISRLMMRLVDQGLLENTRGGARGTAKAWRLTAAGQELVRANTPPDEPADPGGHSDPHEPSDPGELSDPVTRGDGAGGVTLALVAGVPASGAFRLTVRTYRVLAAVKHLVTPDFSPSNREISQAAGIKDQGQISKLLRRLQAQGLLENAGGATAGVPNAWHLTPRGEDLVHAGNPLSTQSHTSKESR